MLLVTCCDTGVATELLETDWFGINLSLAKLVAWLHADLVAARATGKASMKLFMTIKVVRNSIHSNTQEVEGVNSIIRLISERCRTVGLDLLDARVRVKKALGLGSAGQPTKWSHRRPKALSMLHTAMQHLSDIKPIVSNRSRWSVPGPLRLPANFVAIPGEVGAVLTAESRWAKAQALLFHRLMKKPDVTKVFSFTAAEDLSVGAEAWVVVDKSYASSFAIRLSASAVDAELALLEVVTPRRAAMHSDVRC